MKLVRAACVNVGDFVACAAMDHDEESPNGLGAGPIVFREVRNIFQHKHRVEFAFQIAYDFPGMIRCIIFGINEVLLVANELPEEVKE